MNSNWSYSPETPNLGQIRRFLALCDLEIWRMTLKNNRAPLLSNIKLYVSFHHHMWIQTGVTVRKRLSWVVISVTLTCDLWEHSQKGVTDGQTTDRRTESTIHRAAWSQLKNWQNSLNFGSFSRKLTCKAGTNQLFKVWVPTSSLKCPTPLDVKFYKA